MLPKDPGAVSNVTELKAGKVLIRRIVNDLDTPVGIYLKLTNGEPYSFLLESVEGGEQMGRYSIIGLKPDAIWKSDKGTVSLNEAAPFSDDTASTDDRPPLESLKAFIKSAALDMPSDAPPMGSGVFGFLGYEIVGEIEHLQRGADNNLGVEDSVFIRPRLIAVIDKIRQETVLVATARPLAGQSLEEAILSAEQLLDDGARALAGQLAHPSKTDRYTNYSAKGAAPESTAGNQGEISANLTREDFTSMVAAAKDYIRAGDIFQTVLSIRFQTPFNAPPFELYRALRRKNPSPFLFYFNFGGFSLVGSSPEILVRVRNNTVTIRPIAGTRPRGSTLEEDQRLEQDLLADPKERAEHLMLLDLGRNDVGRSAAMGSVTVTEQFQIERYSHVMHIVSNVEGKLAEGVDPVDAVAWGFPAGTVSGAPKIRAMEIIEELEPDARGPYGGAIGYFSADGTVDTCIALRTALVKDGQLVVQAGAGIVADSDPDSEYEECQNKAKALFAAADEVNSI
ncbi:MAG: anthranilate synthase component I [Pseudomonadota bacterium]